MPPGQLRFDHFSADGGRRLLATAQPRAVWSVHIVVAGDARLNAEVLAEVAAHALAEQLLPPVSVLWHRRIGIRFLQRDNVLRDLLVRCIHARRGGIKKALDTELPRRHQQVRVDQHRQHAQGAIVLDEPHATHVRRQVVNHARTTQRSIAGVLLLEVEPQVFHIWEDLVPLVDRLEVDSTNSVMTLTQEIGDQVTADEAARATHDHDLVRIHSHSLSMLQKCRV